MTMLRLIRTAKPLHELTDKELRWIVRNSPEFKAEALRELEKRRETP